MSKFNTFARRLDAHAREIFAKREELEAAYNKAERASKEARASGNPVAIARADAALLEAYNTLKIKEKNRSAEMMRMLEIKEESPKMETVQYYWLDDLVDRVEFNDDTMKVFWKCGLTNKVDMVIPKNRKPEVIAKRYCAMQNRILEGANKPVNSESLVKESESKRPADAPRTAARQAAMNLRARQKGKVANDN